MFIPFVATRYLFSRKKHNTINLITWVSIVGVAVGTMALVVILSVMNGFERVVTESFSDFDPELKIVPADGVFIDTGSDTIRQVKSECAHTVWCEVIEQDGLLQYDRSQIPARIKGVDENYNNIANLDSITWEGEIDFGLTDGYNVYGAMGIGLAQQLGVGASSPYPVMLYVPKRQRVNLARPDANFTKTSFSVGGVFFSQQQVYDETLAIIPIVTMRQAYRIADNQCTSIELRISPIGEETDNKAIEKVQKEIRQLLGPDYTVLNRHEQQTDFYRISKIEKWSTFMILCFILLIATFNIIGSLAMIVIEKRNDITLFSSLGASYSQLRQLFTATGFAISLVGTAIGTIMGIAIVTLQAQFGLIRLGSGFITDVYPVDLQLFDIICVVLIVLTMGYLAALYTVRSQIKNHNHEI